MVKVMKHRGPDDSGTFVRDGIGLAHTRLSIIDLSAFGHQPMISDDGQVALAYNGEVYNFHELRRRLQSSGHRFRGQSDTEVVLRAYEQWGEQAFGQLEGMFALAVWDGRNRRLLLARDRFGIKPLYFRRSRRTGAANADELVFGSEIKTILECGDAKQVNYAGLHEYLYFGTALGSNTMFNGIQKLLPGHFLAIGKDGLRYARFARPQAVVEPQDDLATAVHTVRDLLNDAVRNHLASDVPVGVFLSGGIDSSAITAFASRHYDGGLETFSAGFDTADVDSELLSARRTAAALGTEHHEVIVRGEHVRGVLERLVRCHDEPFGDPAGIALFALSSQVTPGTKVILQGDGGDELFGGYRRHALMSHYRWWCGLARSTKPMHPAISRLSGDSAAETVLGALSETDWGRMMARLLASESPSRPPTRVFAGAMREQLTRSDPFSRCQEIDAAEISTDSVIRLIGLDANVMLPDLFFEKVDKPTMHHGIEVRVPMTDTRLAAYVMGLPSKFKVVLGDKKVVLREALRGILPNDTLARPKAGLDVPIGHWLRTSLAEYMKSVFFDPATLRFGLFDRTALSACIDEHQARQRDNGRLLYKLLKLALWCNEYRPDFGPARPASAAGVASVAAVPAKANAPAGRSRKRHRVVFVVSGLERGGAEHQLVQSANGLADRGWDVTVLSYSAFSKQSLRDELREPRARAITLGAKRGMGKYAVVFRAIAAVRCLRPDLLVGVMFHGMMSARVLGPLLGVPINVSCVHSDRHSAARERWLRLTRCLPSAVVALSGGLAKGLVRGNVALSSRLHVVPNAVGIDQFQGGVGRQRMRRSLRLPDSAFVWFAAGRLEVEKDYPNMLRAFRAITTRNPHAMLVIAGSGSEEPMLRRMVAHLGIAERVRLLGLRQDVPNLLAAADGFVLSSAWEGMPVVVLEAMAASCPVVATAVGAIPDIVTSRMGIVVPPRDSTALAAGLARIMDMPDEARVRMMASARARVRAEHSRAGVLDQWEALFSRLLDVAPV